MVGLTKRAELTTGAGVGQAGSSSVLMHDPPSSRVDALIRISEVVVAKVKKLDGGAEKAVDETEEAAGPEADDATAAGPAEAEADEQRAVERTESVAAFWAGLRIDPVELALPRGVGFTLRAYRSSDELTLSEIDREEDDFTILERRAADTAVEFDDTDLEEIDEEELTRQALGEEEVTSDTVSDETAETEADTENLEEEETAEETEAKAENEDVPVFLGHAGWLYLFRTRQALVDFVKSDSDHDFTQLDTWSELKQGLTEEKVAPDEADRYELDLVVENLRGGQDVWDADLMIRAGEIARDLGYAIRLDTVLSALASGSPLDDLDEALRNSQEGGFGGFFARRRLKKIGIQQAALGWRTIIGKISAAVDWRE